MDVDKFIARANQALRKRAAPQAIALLRQVLVAKPGHPEARAQLLAAYRRKAELKGGPSLMDRAAARAARAAIVPLRGGKRPAWIVKTADGGLERDATDAVLVGDLAAALEDLGYQGAALAAWMYRVDLDEADTVALKEAAKLHWALRRIDEAVECLERAHRVDPRDPETEKLRKNLAAEGTLKTTKYETAASSKELIKDRDALRSAERTGRLHRTGDELDDDAARLSGDVGAAPDDVDARRRLVDTLVAQGRFDEAETAAREGVAAAPGRADLEQLVEDVRLKRAAADVAAAEAGGNRRAATTAKQAQAAVEREVWGARAARSPSDAPIRVRLAKAAYRLGDLDAALENFQAAVSDPRCRVECQRGLGACFLAKGMLPLAARQFEAALEGVGGVGGDHGKEICYHLGLVCERQGDTQGALARFMQVYEVDIHYRDVAQKIEALGS